MATATVDSSASNDNHHNDHLNTESLPLIDLRLLSQSELLSLSLCSSSSSSSLHRLQIDTEDVSTPKIDRSVFNESAGSRKQTFSRLRLAPRNNNSQFGPSSSNSTPIPFQSTEPPLEEENSQIISRLKCLFGSDSQSNENNEIERFRDNNLISVPVHFNEYMSLPCTTNAELKNISIGIADCSTELGINLAGPNSIGDSSSRKRKRGRPRKNENVNYNCIQLAERESSENESKAIVECYNAEVENEVKWSVEDPYGEELRRRTDGMKTEAEILGFLEGLEGEWGSSRKKRKIVDASVLGDTLPRGWKLMVCIKKRASHFWLALGRYIRFLTVFFLDFILL